MSYILPKRRASPIGSIEWINAVEDSVNLWDELLSTAKIRKEEIESEYIQTKSHYVEEYSY